MAVRVGERTITLSRHRTGSEFTDKERALFNAIRPHFAQALENSIAITTLQSLPNNSRPNLRQPCNTMFVATNRGAICTPSPVAQQLFINFGLQHKAQGYLPPLVQEWIFAQSRTREINTDIPAPTAPLVVKKGTNSLHLRAIPNGSQSHILLTQHSSADARPRDSRLTQRENEVLWWVTKGKTNPEIGQILGISRRTVQKHLERVYCLLGVENRYAAMRMSLTGAHQDKDGNE